MSLKMFMTGTDTGIGKTYASIGMLKALNKLGLSTLALKPIASGIYEGNYPTDTLYLHHAASLKLPYNQMTPFAFRPAIAPHIAAQKIDCHLSLDTLNSACLPSLNLSVDVCLIEGFGGWHAPINETETMAQFVSYHKFDVILVIGLKLGCLNHAILTQKAIGQSGCKLVGWIGNCIDPHMLVRDENILTLRNYFSAPCLGIIKYGEDALDSLDENALVSLFCHSTQIGET